MLIFLYFGLARIACEVFSRFLAYQKIHFVEFVNKKYLDFIDFVILDTGITFLKIDYLKIAMVFYQRFLQYSKTSILEYQKMYSKIGVYSKIEAIYEVFMKFGPQQKIYL